MTARAARAGAAVASLLCLAAPAGAELPEAGALLASLGLSPGEVAQVEAGQLVRHDVAPASERELTAGLAFHVPLPPAQLVANSKQDLLDRVDPNLIGYGAVPAPGSLAAFAKLTLEPGAATRAAQYTSAQPGGNLNLSAEEIAAFQGLGSGASPAAVEAQVRAALLARVQAYRTKGLAGIAPYALAGGKTRSPAEEIRTATNASKKLEQYAPAAFQLLQDYPNGKPPGTEEILRWSQFDAHGTPTIALTHVLIVPDGDAYLLAQRQFYVSTGYNAEQALAAFLPAKDGGTVVVYGNRTSTDQITGFGGGTKRSLGSKILASQLETMFEKARAAAK
ncbi:MAG: hypothetical protein OZ948_17650 [Deltaproteobacteria bacterium]|nr:hypothetical protein [Deltaproteobacteria bacterium]